MKGFFFIFYEPETFIIFCLFSTTPSFLASSIITALHIQFDRLGWKVNGKEKAYKRGP